MYDKQIKMPKTKNIYQEGTKIKLMCRVCLTQSNSIMFKLVDPLKANDNIDAETYLQALEKAVCTRVELNGKYPESICPMCVSFLKMSLQFTTQFKESQKKLQNMFKTSTPAYYDTIKQEYCESELISKTNNEMKSEQMCPVELIVKDQTYNLNELVVVEKTDSQHHVYEGFINNLGKEISATIVNSQHSKNTDISLVKIEANEEDSDNSDTFENQDEVERIKIEFNSESSLKSECEESTEVENTADSVIEYIVEEDLENNESSEEQENENNEENEDSESKNENYEYIKIDMLDKYTIESLIIDREKEDDIEDIEKPKLRRKRKRSTSNISKDEFEREVKFPCEICKKIFSTSRSLNNHIRRTHMAKYEKVFTCEICGTICETRSKFVNHKLQHIEKQFKCKLCDKAYSTKAHLKVHMNVHANTRPYLCNVCGKDFNYANALTYHMRLHTGEKNYHCEYCPRTFRMINSLNRHVRTHTGEKPYKCQYCGRHFSSKGEVVCHEYIHTGFRPYHCKYCKKGFSKTHNLKIHLLSHGGPFHCKFCNKTFIEENILSMHHRISHKDLMAEMENENSESNEESPGDEELKSQLEELDDSTVEYVEVEEIDLNDVDSDN